MATSTMPLPLRSGRKSDHNIGIAATGQLPRLHHDLGSESPTNAEQSIGKPVPVTAHFPKTSEEEYEEQLRNLVRVVSACTLGLWSFAAGILIGTFFLF
jgi:hypothetical protein